MSSEIYYLVLLLAADKTLRRVAVTIHDRNRYFFQTDYGSIVDIDTAMEYWGEYQAEIIKEMQQPEGTTILDVIEISDCITVPTQ